MVDAVAVQQQIALLDTVVRTDGHQIGGHDLAHPRFARRPPLEFDLARIIVLGQDSGEPVAVEYENGADVPLDHQPQRMEHRVVKRHDIQIRRVGALIGGPLGVQDQAGASLPGPRPGRPHWRSSWRPGSGGRFPSAWTWHGPPHWYYPVRHHYAARSMRLPARIR